MSQVEVDKIIPQSGTTLTIGDSGDTITVASGATLTGDLNADNLTSGTVPDARITGAYTGITQTGTLTSFASTGIDDNATSTAITIDSSENVAVTGNITFADGHFIGNGAGDNLEIISGTGENIIYKSDGGIHAFYNNSGTEYMRIDISGNVAIGTTSGNKQLTLESSGSNCGIRINNSVTGRPATIGFDDSNDLTIWNNSTNGNIKFYNQTGSGLERMRIDSSGHAIIPAGVTLGTSAGTYNAANTLDDYEEGTWTPTLSYSTSGTATLSENGGVYTKVGRMVTVHMEIDVSNTNSGSGAVVIGGLPFTVGNLLSPTGDEANGSVGFYSGFSTGVNSLFVTASQSSTNLSLRGLTSSTSTGSSAITASDMGTGEIRASITYFTT